MHLHLLQYAWRADERLFKGVILIIAELVSEQPARDFT